MSRHTTNRKSVAKSKPRRPRMENLERRELMAGNITAGLGSDGILHIDGDNWSNGVEVRQVGSQWNGGSYGPVVQVRGLYQSGAQTKINGASSQTFYVVRGLDIDMNGGSDRVNIGSSTGQYSYFSKGVTVVTGSGHDDVNLNKVSTYLDTQIWTGSGNDDVTLNNVRAGSNSDEFRQGGLYIYTESGHDEIVVKGTTVVNSMEVNVGAGGYYHDKVELDHVNVGGNLTLTNRELDSWYNTGRVTATMEDVNVGRKLTIDTLLAKADLELERVNADEVFAQLGSRDDSLSLTDVQANSITAHGNRGEDSLFRSGSSRVNHDGFEDFNFDYSWLAVLDWRKVQR